MQHVQLHICGVIPFLLISNLYDGICLYQIFRDSDKVSTGTSGISKILESIGGPSRIILYVMVIALYAYIMYSGWGKSSQFTLQFGSDDQRPHGKEINRLDSILQAQEQIDDTFVNIEKQGFLRPAQMTRPSVKPVRA